MTPRLSVPQMADLQRLGRSALGSRREWFPGIARPRLPRLGWASVGPAAVVVSASLGWLAFAGATGEDGSVRLGLFLGSVSIVLMAWSFLLAVRLRWLERFFGGLDSMYVVHRWAGMVAIAAMYLHTSIEPEIEDGIRGASKSMADSAEDLAGTGQNMLYILVGISLLRWFPYRFWRLTHKLLGIPFAFACLHFITAEKTYSNNSPWGWWFGTIMAVGMGGWALRVFGRDVLARGTRYRIVDVRPTRTTTELELAPIGRALEHRAGQFAAVKLQARGMTEPHMFSIASSPGEANLRFHVRNLGDWTGRLHRADPNELIGIDVFVEGPYGEFDPISPNDGQTVWVAGGVGITPFLSIVETLPPQQHFDRRPTLIYCVSERSEAVALDQLTAAQSDGRIRLEIFASAEGRRFTSERFREVVGPDVTEAHVAACGPTGLLRSVESASRSLGARGIDTESFDIRSGVGPDLSSELERLATRS